MIATIDDTPIELEGDWHAFAEWGRTFGGHGQLRHLAEFRWSQDLDTLAAEIDDALIATVPTLDVERFAERLRDEIDNNNGEVLAISDGPERAVLETFREQEWDGLEWCLEV